MRISTQDNTYIYNMFVSLDCLNKRSSFLFLGLIKLNGSKISTEWRTEQVRRFPDAKIKKMRLKTSFELDFFITECPQIT